MMEPIIICVRAEELIPEKKSPEAMCWDVKADETFTLQPGELKLVKSWIKTFIPTGWCAKLHARSSLPFKNGLLLANGVWLIDSDYRGEYWMQLYNFTQNPVTIQQYTRLCQLEFAPHHWWVAQYGTAEIPQVEIKVDGQLFDTFDQVYSSERWTGGFGSTGAN